jgi:hypothetical protein
MEILLKFCVCVCVREREREREFGQQLTEEHFRKITMSLQDNPIQNLQ